MRNGSACILLAPYRLPFAIIRLRLYKLCVVFVLAFSNAFSQLPGPKQVADLVGSVDVFGFALDARLSSRRELRWFRRLLQQSFSIWITRLYFADFKNS